MRAGRTDGRAVERMLLDTTRNLGPRGFDEINYADDAGDYGWPYCFYDGQAKLHVLAPEYGGDGKRAGRCARIEAPLAAYTWDNMNDPRLNKLDGTVAPTGSFKRCRSSWNVYDMVGNLHEWTAAENGTFRGGYYLDTQINGAGCEYKTTAHAPRYRDYSTGCVMPYGGAITAIGRRRRTSTGSNALSISPEGGIRLPWGRRRSRARPWCRRCTTGTGCSSTTGPGCGSVTW